MDVDPSVPQLYSTLQARQGIDWHLRNSTVRVGLKPIRTAAVVYMLGFNHVCLTPGPRETSVDIRWGWRGERKALHHSIGLLALTGQIGNNVGHFCGLV